MNSKVFASRTSLIAAVSMAAILPGCLVDLDHDHRLYDGTVVVDWTIERGKDPLDCRLNGADTIEISIESRSGRVIDVYPYACEEFSAAIDLDEGSYAGTAVMLDRRNTEISTPVDLGTFRIYQDADTVIPIDFPLDSFR